MISYIVASHRPETLEKHLKASLKTVDNDELIVIENAESIAKAYNLGISKAKNKIKCFIHNDVIVIDSDKLRHTLIENCLHNIGMVGVIGTTNKLQFPWWQGRQCGNVVDARLGLINFSKGDCYCAILDGLLLATSQDINFDEDYTGFHLYDHDICRQMLRRGLFNFCLPDGKTLVSHHTSGPLDTGRLIGWKENVARYKDKWKAVGFEKVAV